MKSLYYGTHGETYETLEIIESCICLEQTNLDPLVIVLCDLNKGNLSRELPKYRPLMTCPTRECNIPSCSLVMFFLFH